MREMRVVDKMMQSLKIEGLPLEYCEMIRDALRHIYVAGWEQCHTDMFVHPKNGYAQYNEDNVLVGTYNGINKASKITGFCKDTIYRSIRTDKPIRGFLWRKITIENDEDSFTNNN